MNVMFLKLALKALLATILIGLLVLAGQEISKLKIELKTAQQNVAQLTAVNQADQIQIATFMATQQRVADQSEALAQSEKQLHLIAEQSQKALVCGQTADKTMSNALDQIRAAQQELPH